MNNPSHAEGLEEDEDVQDGDIEMVKEAGESEHDYAEPDDEDSDDGHVKEAQVEATVPATSRGPAASDGPADAEDSEEDDETSNIFTVADANKRPALGEGLRPASTDHYVRTLRRLWLEKNRDPNQEFSIPNGYAL